MWLLLLLLTAILPLAISQDPIEDFCRRHQHQTCIIDSKLYIDGGKVYYGGSVENGSIAQQNTRLLWENVMETDNNTDFPKQYKDLRKDSDVPSVSGGVLWPDNTNKLFYLFGGEYNEVKDVRPFTNLWFFDVLNDTWIRAKPSDNQISISWPAFGSGTITEGGTAYYYGGYLNNKTVFKWGNTNPLMLNSLVSFDMNTQTWSNRTHNTTPRAEGMLHYLPASRSGMLVYFGGLQTNPNGEVTYANMSEIQLFDISDGRWYMQTASGEVPQPRRGACAGVIWAEDRSSYNFYVWGGIGVDGRAVAEIYILSLPSFQWTLIFPKTLAEVPHYSLGRGWSTCNVVRESQMIIMGGLFNDEDSSCFVPEHGSQCGLLLGQESMEVLREENMGQDAQWWWALRNNINGYRVPDKITSLIGGNISGHATKTTPVLGWATPSLSGYFKGFNYVPPRTATRSVPTTSTSAPISQSTSSGPNIGAIAGGTVGGVVALIGLVAIVFFCLRSRRPQQTHNQPKELDSNPTPELDDSAMAKKLTATYAVSEGGTVHSSVTPTPAYSPQASPPPPPRSWHGEQSYHQSPPSQTGEWTQQSGNAYSQNYYPPPPEPSQALKQLSPHEISAELPNIGSPTSAELPDVRSPTNAELPDWRSPGPLRGPQ